ncbi:MAG: penicillin-binding transpeptidase domain-containing protein [Firmicutes bacterium]|nr:penicillin-binding transpeptidase domain-containing protein [Bacillota bacterium]
MSNSTTNFTTTRKRLLFFVLAITFLFVMLFGRLACIQLIQGRELQQRATQQWYRELPLRAPRGHIYDREGRVLVDNRDVFSIYVRPRAVVDKPSLARTLSGILFLDEQKILESISRVVSEVTIARRVEEPIAEQIRSLNLDGVYLAPETIRNFPHKHSLSRVLGFTNIDNQGQSGLEVFYDVFLRGSNGFTLTNTDMAGRETEDTVTRYVPPIPGANMELTIDSNIQSFADFAVMSAMQEWGANSASMIVMDVRDSGIVAMSHTPHFDLNDPPRDDIELLNALSKNTMIVDVFEPGSTFKIFTTAAALEHGLVTVDDRFHCIGHNVVDGQRIRCWRTIGHGSQTLREGVRNSCNVVFMNLGARLGIDRLYNALENFGFGSRTNIDFFGESPGLMVPRSYVKNIDLARIAFGQAVAVTPLQLINGVSAVVNGGVLNEPHFVRSITDFQGRTIMNRGAREVRRVISPETSAIMNELLEATVADGSGRRAQVPGFRIGGKTGTAQKYIPGGGIAQGRYISSFVGFAPVDNPRYAILMLVDEPSKGAYYGGIVAAPHAGDVFSRIFDYINLAPTTLPIPPNTVTMPLLVGRTPQEAAAILRNMDIHFEISGEVNPDQSVIQSTLPIPGTQMPANSVVLLRLRE